jgi:DNA polymerase I-like protein with 3'-5' exonuclease and polymerase domains
MQIITQAEELDAVVDYFRNEADYFCFDVETIGEHRGDPWRNTVAWISVGDSQKTFVIPCGHPNGEVVEQIFPLRNSKDLEDRLARGLKPRKSDYSVDSKKAHTVFTEPPEQLDRTTVFGALKPIFFDDDLLKVGQNVGFDLGSVAKYLGDIPSGPYADTMIAAFLVDSSRSFGFGLKDLAKKYADMDISKGIGENVAEYAFSDVAQYSGLDVIATSKVWLNLRERIVSDKLERVFALEMDVVPVVTRMRLAGTPVDVEALESLKVRLSTDLEAIKADVYRMAGKKFNLNSTSEKQRLLYASKQEGGRALRPKSLTPGGRSKKRNKEALTISDYSVAADALEFYRDSDPLVARLLQYADYNKLLSTYVLPYTDDAPTDGRKKRSVVDSGVVHTELVQIGAATGRFSSRNPNLQNIPAPGTEYGKLIRNLFIAPPGHQMIVADYSQIEPRIIASTSKDPVMIGTYRDGGDIYTAIGEKMGVDRKAGKILVLSIAYGVGPDKISSQIGCTIPEATALLNEFDEQFPKVGWLKSQTIRKAISSGKRSNCAPYVCTITGRRRYLPELVSDVWYEQARAERQCFNTFIQGSAADIIKMAMVFAHRSIPVGSSLVLSIHDELVTIAPDHLVEETASAIRSAMEGIAFLKVPLVADLKVVDKWGMAK